MDDETPETAQKRSLSRAMHVAMALAVGVALALFLVETTPGRRAHASAKPSESTAAAPAPAYADLRTVRRGPNAGMYQNAFDAFQPNPEPVSSEESTPEARQQALSERGSRRAYDGAPPVIPHAVGQREPADCLACHERGARIAGKAARPLSHERYASCTQCHVVQNAPGPLVTVQPENTFSGLRSFGDGARAWNGAPPTIPHPTRMRSRCDSCHGPNGLFGLRTPHPERQSCQQCHAPSAQLEQRELADLPPIGFRP